MWPFVGSSRSSSTGSASRSSAEASGLKPAGLEVPQGADGIASDVPVIAYTEKVRRSLWFPHRSRRTRFLWSE